MSLAPHRRWVLRLLVVLALLSLGSAVRAATVTDFGDSNDPGQLRTLLNAAANGDSIAIPPGTITLKLGELVVAVNLTIEGAGANATFIDGDKKSRVFNIKSLKTVGISGLTIENGSDVDGGGIFVQPGARLTLGACKLLGNTTIGDGGGVRNEFSAVEIADSTLSGNTATGSSSEGGGISNREGTVRIIDSTLSDNSATLAGGAIYSGESAVLKIINSTLSHNSAEKGGGIFSGNTAIGSTSLFNVTITNNFTTSPPDTGGGIFSNNGSVSLQNTIVAGNRDPDAPDCASANNGVFVSGGYNLIGDATGCNFNPVLGDQVGTSAAPIDPILGPLQGNGGPTQTHALLTGSPAIDRGNPSGCIDEKGNPLTQDQRGAPRPVDGNGDGVVVCDIGAYELQLVRPAPAVSPWVAGVLAIALAFAGLVRLRHSGAIRP